MEKMSDQDYRPPTEEELYKSIYQVGIFKAKCRVCGQIVDGKSIKELEQHKCNGKTNF